MITDRDSSLSVEKAVLRLNARAWGISFGLLAGLGLFGTTLFLVLKGGENVGQHLQLLGVFFPGYRVTLAGAFVGLVYGFVVGYGVGRLIGTVYNRLVGS